MELGSFITQHIKTLLLRRGPHLGQTEKGVQDPQKTFTNPSERRAGPLQTHVLTAGPGCSPRSISKDYLQACEHAVPLLGNLGFLSQNSYFSWRAHNVIIEKLLGKASVAV